MNLTQGLQIRRVQESFMAKKVELFVLSFSSHFIKNGTKILIILIVKHFSKNAIQLLKEMDWTGNIRELRNVIERLIILGGTEISESDVQLFASK